ncbi:MAG TPA: helical backbone metal receptor [Deltaproteobacteria bacterium]|nr:helical backbone metal receptor [Deltaproteobacteria bacterium]HQB38905.1 helical backbone metal receptor [Deltaproteobacteria bacterium]
MKNHIGMLYCLLIAGFCLIFVQPADAATRKVPQRIVSLAPAVTEIIYAVGAQNRLVGVTNVCDRPAEASRKSRVGNMANPSLEAIAALKPDLVIVASKENPTEFVRRLNTLRIKTHLFKTNSLDDLPDEIRKLGRAIGAETRTARMAAGIERALKHSLQASAGKAGVKGRRIMFMVWTNPITLAGPGTIIDDAIRDMGMVNVAADSRAPYPRYNLETIIARKPDLIVMGAGTPGMKMDPQPVLKRLKMLEAVRKGRICYTTDALYRPGPRIAEGIAELEKCMLMP